MDAETKQLIETMMGQIRILTAEHEAIISVMSREDQEKCMTELKVICRRQGIELASGMPI